MKAKETKHWIVAFWNEAGEQVGPGWEVESKIKPTRWAKQTCYKGCTYTVEIDNDEDETEHDLSQENFETSSRIMERLQKLIDRPA